MNKFLTGIFSFSLLISYYCQSSEYEKKGTSSSHSLYTLQENGSFEFNPSVENKKIRDEIDNRFKNNLETEFGKIEIIDKNFSGNCVIYAFEHIFNSYFGIDDAFSRFYSGSDMPGNDWIEEYFSVVTEPIKGDLVCYYNDNDNKYGGLKCPVHYGIYDSDDFVLSQWGKGGYAYRHPLFYVGKSYGNFIRNYRFKSHITIEYLSQKEPYRCPIGFDPLPEGHMKCVKFLSNRLRLQKSQQTESK